MLPVLCRCRPKTRPISFRKSAVDVGAVQAPITHASAASHPCPQSVRLRRIYYWTLEPAYLKRIGNCFRFAVGFPNMA